MGDKITPHKGPTQFEPTNVADKRQRSERDAKAWKSHIYKRIVQPVENDEVGAFLREFVHTEKPIPHCPVEKFPGKVPSGKGKEHKMYKSLLGGLTALVEGFEAEKRPEFVNHAHKVMRFPFALGDDDHHVTKPDIIATIPQLPFIPPVDRWRNVALVFEIKPCAADDPMVTYTDAHETTLIQLAKSARNIMLAQGRLYAFVVGIYGHQARIFRFDRAGAVCSPPFDYVKKPHVLHEFMWRFMHPATPGCLVVGDDPTSSLGTSEDRALAQRWASDHDPSYTYTAESRKAVRRFVVTDDEKNETKYLAYKLIFVNPRLFSRATMIWEAFELDKDGKETTGKRVVIKEAWRQFAQPSKIHFYQEMQEAAEEDAVLSLLNIAEFEYGEDLGLRESLELAAEASRTAPGASHGADPSAPSEATEYFGDFPALQVPYQRVLGQRTVTARCRDIRHEYNERSHTRLILKTIGVPITAFESTYEMVRALRDAIEGHRQAYEAGVIHRDISQGNVMIARKPDGSSKGFIHDFDYAFSWKRFLIDKDKPKRVEEWETYARHLELAY